MSTLKEIKSNGYRRGYNIAKNIDLIDIGNYCNGEVSQTGKREQVTTDNWFEVHTNIAYDCESGNRDYSPFEFLAHEINEYEDKKGFSGDAWLVFDEAIGRGIAKALKERWKAFLLKL